MFRIFRWLRDLGVQEGYSTQQSQVVRLTNLVAMIPLLAYIFYVGYGIYFEQWFSLAMASTMSILTLIAIALNALHYHSTSKVVLFFLNSLSIGLTYHVFNVNYAVLSSFFPIIFCYPIFFNSPDERIPFILSGVITGLFILSSFVLPRFVLYEVQLPPDLAQQSNLFHIVISFILTGIVAYVIAKNRKSTYEKLLSQKEEAVAALHELNLTKDRLVESEKMASLGLLSAGINHEINNPLAYLSGATHELKQLIPGDDAEAVLHLEIIHDGVERIKDIVKSLTHFSHQSEKFDDKCDVKIIIDNCLRLLAFNLTQGVKVEKDYNSVSRSITCNSGQLHQVFFNVINNALQAVGQDGQVRIAAKESVSKLIVSIEDNGSGVPKEIEGKIFEAFFTTKEPGIGTGLGLAITKKILKNHGGDIYLSSNSEKGSRFEIVLPLREQ